MEERDDLITLTDEEGNEVDFIVVDGAEYNGKSYLMMVEADQEENENAEAFLLRVDEEGDEEILVTVDDEEEFNAVAKIFEEQEEECGCDCGCEHDHCEGECHCDHCDCDKQ